MKKDRAPVMINSDYRGYRLMCGGGSVPPDNASKFVHRGCAPESGGAAPVVLDSIGRSQTSRTSGGGAANELNQFLPVPSQALRELPHNVRKLQDIFPIHLHGLSSSSSVHTLYLRRVQRRNDL
jgi:hypothetical protein